MNSEGTFSLGSAGLPVRLASVPPSGASGLAVKSTGTTAWLAAMTGASIATPAGRSLRRSGSGRRRSRPGCPGSGSPAGCPCGTLTAIGPVPSGICSALVESVKLRLRPG